MHPQGLGQYGNGFLAKLELAQCPSPLLDEITLVDTPGVLSGEKQRIERTYNFLDVCGWFAARCDLILLLFDPHKLDISDEMKQVGAPLGRLPTRPRPAPPPFEQMPGRSIMGSCEDIGIRFHLPATLFVRLSPRAAALGAATAAGSVLCPAQRPPLSQHHAVAV